MYKTIFASFGWLYVIFNCNLNDDKTEQNYYRRKRKHYEITISIAAMLYNCFPSCYAPLYSMTLKATGTGRR